jgi:hypothetical protein
VDRFTWGIVAGVLALVVVGIATAALVREREATFDLSTPSGVVLAFERALHDGDAERAWELLATSTQNTVGRERFLQRAQDLVNVRGNQAVRHTVEDERVTDETATVDLVRTYRSTGLLDFDGGSSARFTVRLVREIGAWRIAAPAEGFLVAEPSVPLR